MVSLKSFASTDRFTAEIATPSIKPGYVLIGDEVFLYDRCRKAVLTTLAPEETRDFSLHDLDLADTSIFEILDRAQTPSLMAPFQVLFVRNLKTLYSRGSKKEEFAAIDAYFRSPNPQALILFVADHLRIPTDLRKMDYQDKDRYERIREPLGDWCGLVELARVDENDAIKWVTATAESRNVKFDPDAARELVDALGADMMLIASEFEKLLLYVSAPTNAPAPINPAPIAPAPINEVVILSEAKNPRISTEAPTHSQEATQNKVVILSEGEAKSKDLRLPSTSRANTDRVPHPSQSHREGWDTTKSESPILTKNRVTLGDVETMVLAAKQRSLYELTDAISSKDRPRALLLLHGLLKRLRRWRRRRHRPSLHARPHLPPDAHHLGEKRARPPSHLAGPLAGLPHAPLRRRRPDQASPPLQIPPRTNPRHPPRSPRRPRTSQLPCQQTPSPRAPHPRPLHRTQTHHLRTLPTSSPWNYKLYAPQNRVLHISTLRWVHRPQDDRN